MQTNFQYAGDGRASNGFATILDKLKLAQFRLDLGLHKSLPQIPLLKLAEGRQR